jgi:probable phosphoglycerate mutase
VKPALVEIAERGPAVIVAHRALMRAILAHAWDWGFDTPEPFKIKRGHLHPVTVSADGAISDPGTLIPLEVRA